MKFENYRSELASDLREVRNEEGGREKAKTILAQEKQTIRYQEAEELHRSEVGLTDSLEFREDVDREGVLEQVSEKTAEEMKLDLMTEILMEEFEEEVDKRVKHILNKIGSREAEAVEIWGSVRRELIQSVNSDFDALQDERLRTESQEGIRFIDKDNPASSLEKFVSENADNLDGDDLVDLQQWIKDRTIAGEYQLYQYSSSGMLADAVESIRLLSERISVYTSEISSHTVERLLNSAASIKADFKSKPNFSYAKPEMRGSMASANEILRSLARIKAQEFLKIHDIDLPES